MPPRYAYWTILVDNQPTAFRAASQEDLLPTFKRLKQKHDSATMMWFQNGKLWPSRVDAQEAMRMRGERGREGDRRQGGGFRSRQRDSVSRARSEPSSNKLEWQPKEKTSSGTRHEAPGTRSAGTQPDRIEWKPKGSFTPAPKRADRPEWKPKSESSNKLEWQPKGEGSPGTRHRAPSTRPTSGTRHPAPNNWTPKRGYTGAKPEGAAQKRKWIPKDEYKKSQGIEARRDKNWRPGGEHQDPRQKYKDAKKAKWQRFKKNVRSRWETKAGKKKNEG